MKKMKKALAATPEQAPPLDKARPCRAFLLYSARLTGVFRGPDGRQLSRAAGTILACGGLSWASWSPSCFGVPPAWRGCSRRGSGADAGVAAAHRAIQLPASDGMPLFGRGLYWVDAQGGRAHRRGRGRRTAPCPGRLRQREQAERQRGGAMWLRFDAAAPAGQHWYVEVASSVHDHDPAVLPQPAGAWVVQQGGHLRADRAWPVPGRLPTFALAMDDPRTVRYWLRVEDNAADFAAPVACSARTQLQDSREDEQFLFGAYAGIAVLVIVAALANGLLFRDRAFARLRPRTACCSPRANSRAPASAPSTSG